MATWITHWITLYKHRVIRQVGDLHLFCSLIRPLINPLDALGDSGGQSCGHDPCIDPPIGTNPCIAHWSAVFMNNAAHGWINESVMCTLIYPLIRPLAVLCDSICKYVDLWLTSDLMIRALNDPVNSAMHGWMDDSCFLLYQMYPWFTNWKAMSL